MTPYARCPAGVLTATVNNLSPSLDHYFAVVAVDVHGNYNSNVTYSTVYALTSEVVSREVSVVVVPTAPPAAVGLLGIAASPDGSSVLLSWPAYNEWAQGAVVSYRMFVSSTPFTNTSGLTPCAVVPAGTLSTTLRNLPPGVDHFFAVCGRGLPMGSATQV